MEDKARKIIQQYIDGWKENDEEKILSTLSEDFEIIESHGPRYTQKEQVRDWMHVWKDGGGKVSKWDITSFLYDSSQNTAAFQWNFFCHVNQQDHRILGVSIVRLTDGKISYLHEYRMTQDPYLWEKKMKIPT